MQQLYRDNYECAVSTLQYGNRRMEFSEFMYDWHIRKYVRPPSSDHDRDRRVLL